MRWNSHTLEDFETSMNMHTVCITGKLYKWPQTLQEEAWLKSYLQEEIWVGTACASVCRNHAWIPSSQVTLEGQSHQFAPWKGRNKKQEFSTYWFRSRMGRRLWGMGTMVIVQGEKTAAYQHILCSTTMQSWQPPMGTTISPWTPTFQGTCSSMHVWQLPPHNSSKMTLGSVSSLGGRGNDIIWPPSQGSANNTAADGRWDRAKPFRAQVTSKEGGSRDKQEGQVKGDRQQWKVKDTRGIQGEWAAERQEE